MVLALVLLLEVTAFAVIIAAERRAQRADDARISVFQKAGPAWRKRLVNDDVEAKSPGHERKAGRAQSTRLAEPIRVPATVAASEANLRPNELVIGVEVGGEARAYRFASFETVRGHLVNDMVGGVPVSVAYCDLTECLKVYSDPHGSEPLELNVAGVLDGEMIMRHAARMYFHKSGTLVEAGDDSTSLPYSLITPTVTTWKEWLAGHPDTRVYLGSRVDVSDGERPKATGIDQ